MKIGLYCAWMKVLIMKGHTLKGSKYWKTFVATFVRSETTQHQRFNCWRAFSSSAFDTRSPYNRGRNQPPGCIQSGLFPPQLPSRQQSGREPRGRGRASEIFGAPTQNIPPLIISPSKPSPGAVCRARLIAGNFFAILRAGRRNAVPSVAASCRMYANGVRRKVGM